MNEILVNEFKKDYPNSDFDNPLWAIAYELYCHNIRQDVDKFVNVR